MKTFGWTQFLLGQKQQEGSIYNSLKISNSVEHEIIQAQLKWGSTTSENLKKADTYKKEPFTKLNIKEEYKYNPGSINMRIAGMNVPFSYKVNLVDEKTIIKNALPLGKPQETIENKAENPLYSSYTPTDNIKNTFGSGVSDNNDIVMPVQHNADTIDVTSQVITEKKVDISDNTAAHSCFLDSLNVQNPIVVDKKTTITKQVYSPVTSHSGLEPVVSSGTTPFRQPLFNGNASTGSINISEPPSPSLQDECFTFEHNEETPFASYKYPNNFTVTLRETIKKGPSQSSGPVLPSIEDFNSFEQPDLHLNEEAPTVEHMRTFSDFAINPNSTTNVDLSRPVPFKGNDTLFSNGTTPENAKYKTKITLVFAAIVSILCILALYLKYCSKIEGSSKLYKLFNVALIIAAFCNLHHLLSLLQLNPPSFVGRYFLFYKGLVVVALTTDVVYLFDSFWEIAKKAKDLIIK